jgi:hypothetical protein
MAASDWANVSVASAAFVISAATAWTSYRHRQEDVRRADVTVYFHWLTEFAEIKLADGTELPAGYHVVIWNRGPASAEDVGLIVRDDVGHELTFLDVASGEFPLKRMDSGGKYPIPWLLSDKAAQDRRRFNAELTWKDGNGPQHHSVPLRRGQIVM